MTLPLPAIDIVLITYDRYEDIKKTFTALCKNLKYSGKINVYIADDCTPNKDYLPVLEVELDELAYQCQRTWKIIPCQTPVNGGWGRNANHALSKTTSDIVMMIEDDYVITKEIDLDPLVALLLCHQSIGLIRLDGIAGHKVLAHAHETDISSYLPDYRQGVGNCGLVHYWLLDHSSPALNVYSHRPQLKHKRFHEFYGKYIEGAKLGVTEDDFAHRVKDGMKEHWQFAPCIAVPLDANNFFDHVGVSRQHTALDKEHK